MSSIWQSCPLVNNITTIDKTIVIIVVFVYIIIIIIVVDDVQTVQLLVSCIYKSAPVRF